LAAKDLRNYILKKEKPINWSR